VLAPALLLAACSPSPGQPQAASARAPVAMAHPSAAPTNASGDRPRIISSPDLEDYCPEEAEARHVDGMVRIAVTLDESGRATDTRLLSVTPPDMGFGAAASTVVHLMTFSNPTGRTVVVRVPIKFALNESIGRHRHVRLTDQR
jgi:TonB family protein